MNKYDSTVIIESVKDSFGSSNPGPGCTFIAEDGLFVNIYPKVDTHEDLCEWVADTLDIELEYSDEEYFVREFGCIRLRSDHVMSIIELPGSKPTNKQWYSLEDWLLYLEDRYSGRSVPLYLDACDNNSDGSVEYAFGKDYFAEDILKICKRYYGSNKLYANTRRNSMKRAIKAYTAPVIFDLKDGLEMIADRYTTSDPVSGDWDTEIEHEVETIAQAFNISEKSAKDLMINELGFGEIDFVELYASTKPRTRRPISANAQIGEYNNVPYGIEDDHDQQFYFVDKYGKVHYADTEEELFSKIDSVTAATKSDSSKLPSILNKLHFEFWLTAGNYTYQDDLLDIVEKHNGKEVSFYRMYDNGRIYDRISKYVVPAEQDAHDIFNEAKKSIVIRDRKVYPKFIDWENCYMIYIEDYNKGRIKLDWHSKLPK